MSDLKTEELSPEQAKAIETFALTYGRSWKEKLRTIWNLSTKESYPNGYLLRQIRNSFGPNWLLKVKLPKSPK